MSQVRDAKVILGFEMIIESGLGDARCDYYFIDACRVVSILVEEM